MDTRCFTVLFLLIIHIIPAFGQAVAEGLSCQEHQQAFESSCYEFVALQHSFLSAQSWCERGGGHLVFIQNDETQQFLQKHLQPEQNWWIGLAPAFDDLTLELQSIWLDGSDVMYSNWLSESILNTGCGYIDTDSGFHWKTSNCSKEFYFICEFELGHSVSCMNHNPILQCGSDQVIEIDESIYGRKTPHYCRNSMPASLTASQEQCSWVNVLDLVTEQCNGRQLCLAVTDTSYFGEPCPGLGSYLLVEYHCKDKASGVIVKRNQPQGPSPVEWKCVPTPVNRIHVDTICQNCKTEAFGVQILLKDKQNCDKLDWYLEEKSATGGLNECPAGQIKLKLQKHNSKQLSIKTAELKPFEEDFILEAICIKDNNSKIFTIPFSLLNRTTNQLLSRVSDQLFQMTETNITQELREKLLSNICAAFNNSNPIQQSIEVQMVANALKNIVEVEEELNTNAQLQAGCILVNIGHALNFNDLTQYNVTELMDAATLIIQCSSHVLAAFQRTKEEEIADYMFSAVESVQKFLLSNKGPDEEPVIINSNHISVSAYRVSPGNVHTQYFNIQNVSSSTFSLPNLGPDVLPVNEPVDVRQSNFYINPWIEDENVNSVITGFSLARNGSDIPVADLTEEIEIFIPRLDKGANSTVLDLRNYSTMIINVATPNINLVFKLDPTEDLNLLVLLGYQVYPTTENYAAKVILPQEGNTQEERYTWIVSPRETALNTGDYYLLIRPIVAAGVKSVNASVTITSIGARCTFRAETSASNWRDSGCRVGPKTTEAFTHCLCTHLTVFGSSFFVMPNTVDPSQSAQLFANFANNPVVVCFIGAIFLVYILTATWARRKDLQDKAKVKVTVLEDNDPLAEYRYLLKISTGHRIGSSTSSQVIVTLQGTEGESAPHHLNDPEKPVFERGGVDLFLLTTPYSLGELQSIRLWHDNTGDHPAWYVNTVMVQDMQTDQKWHFLCSSWLAVDIEECTVDKVFPVATEMDLKGFSNLFFMKTTTDFCDGHIWYSVVSRPPSSNFTRVQRVSCCFSILLCSMLTSIMFYGIPTDPSEQTMDLGQIQLTWSQVIIGIQSSIIVFPVNLLIVGIFRHARPRKKTTKQKKHKLPEPLQMEKDFEQNNVTIHFLIKDIQRISYLFANAMRCSVPKKVIHCEKADIITLLSELQNLIEEQHFKHKNEASSVFWTYIHHLYKQLENVEGEVKLLGPSGFSRPGCYSQVLLQVQSIKKLLESNFSSRPINELRTGSSNPKKDRRGGLPWWFVYVGWFLVLATSVVSGYFTMLYGLKYGKDRSISWIISIVMSFTESLFFTQPVKVLCFAIFFALVVKNVNYDDAELVEKICKKTTTSTDGLDGVRLAKRDCANHYYQPPPSTDLEKMRSNMVKQQKARALIMEILVFLGFLWMLLLVAYGQRDPNAYYLTQHIRQSFSNGTGESMNQNDVFTWAKSVLLSNLFGQYPGFITDGNSKLVGSARLRQVRVRTGSCEIAKSMQNSVPDCNAPYSWENEDMGSYGPGWDQSGFVNGSEDIITAWQYQSQSELRSYPIWGMIALYRGGGYAVDLGSDLQNASRKLQYLLNSTWLDKYTRAVFAEFTVYNANVNLFCIVTLILESTAVGAFEFRSVVQSIRLYQSTGGFQSFLMASQAFYLLFIIYYMFLQAKQLKRHKWAYFKNKWNLLDLAIIILSWSALSVFIKRTVQGDKDIAYYQKNKDQFPSFNDTAIADATLGYLMAFLVLLASVKLWHLLRLNPKLRLITSSLQRAWNELSSFTVVIFIVFLAYALTCNLIFGGKLYSYKTVPEAFLTIFSLQLGIFNYDEVVDSDPLLAVLIVTTCVVFITFVILTLFVSVILEAFSEEQQNHQPSEEEEIVNLILMKILSLFGIKCKKREADDKETLPSESTT
ncbi:polycystic kidney disease protein 1-like 2 [Myxocyprinus asiaticus]|uniref:polycystic kidney disease protein 1-like 2 n=1 Tax=Myxocyprinus asiaticus TaxID=70543 RepID=UPI002222F82B|nr:polycystic kidney disease protein 1-like 2 [Myxocyprinus asiaticus]